MKEFLRELLRECGILDFGVCSFRDFENRLLPCRAASRLPDDAKSIISAVFPYKVASEPPENISRYAAVPDYHAVCGAMLKEAVIRLSSAFPENKFCSFIDNSPIPEVAAAAAAGLGVRGKNGLLITPEYGSFVFIGEIVTDMAIEPSANPSDAIPSCDECGACLSACPRRCAGGDMSLCLSAITQKKGNLSEEDRRLILSQKSAWGCDICQESCPMNTAARTTYIKPFLEGSRCAYNPDEDGDGRAYTWRGRNVIDRNFLLLKKHD